MPKPGELTAEAREALLAWFGEHKRDLPWRHSRDPYAIWVSEIMLQQTRVAAVLEHYARWMQRFPTVATLAAAEEPEVLALWSGLGYYRRARMLHRAARVVADEHNGTLPQTAAALQTLPGIGAYTSAAIASIAFGEAVAVVDGNVERVVTRLLGLAVPEAETPAPTGAALAKTIRAGAAALVCHTRPGDANQAMMELGATVCLPRAPLCLHCPLRLWCCTRGEHIAAPRPAQLQKQAAYALIAQDAEVLLRQRPATASLMASMWELPELAAMPAGEQPALRLRHAITVTNYEVFIFRQARNPQPGETWQPVEQLPHLALTGLARKALRRAGLWPAARERHPIIEETPRCPTSSRRTE